MKNKMEEAVHIANTQNVMLYHITSFKKYKKIRREGLHSNAKKNWPETQRYSIYFGLDKKSIESWGDAFKEAIILGIRSNIAKVLNLKIEGDTNNIRLGITNLPYVTITHTEDFIISPVFIQLKEVIMGEKRYYPKEVQ